MPQPLLLLPLLIGMLLLRLLLLMLLLQLPLIALLLLLLLLLMMVLHNPPNALNAAATADACYDTGASHFSLRFLTLGA